ncbi:MAG: hypothetical protein K0U70_04025 [Actinomycetia bacterium]|nr:hypothetical protein [Actinomycetes bacterium]MCH9710161.1 hypothetical protein [Actinomycetes bacterium]MCH9766947.1 hypothetical protein [Actinomycetes bacterium]
MSIDLFDQEAVMATQRQRLAQLKAALAEEYPGVEGEKIREEVLDTAREYLRGEVTVAEIGEELADARLELATAIAAAKVVGLLAIENGELEQSTARELGVDHPTVRDWQIGRLR